jgi:hypothetical protein
VEKDYWNHLRLVAGTHTVENPLQIQILYLIPGSITFNVLEIGYRPLFILTNSCAIGKRKKFGMIAILSNSTIMHFCRKRMPFKNQKQIKIRL